MKGRGKGGERGPGRGGPARGASGARAGSAPRGRAPSRGRDEVQQQDRGDRRPPSRAKNTSPKNRFGANNEKRREDGRKDFAARAEKSIQRPHKEIQRDRFQRDRSQREEMQPRRDIVEDAGAFDEASAQAPVEQVSTAVQTVLVGADESGMRVDRFLEAKIPGLSFAHIQRMVRKGELRVDGKRVDSKDRLEEGQKVRIPPVKRDAPMRPDEERRAKVRAELKEITLYEDDDVLVINKPYGLAVQGGSGTVRHVDGMLLALMEPDGQRPRLVHRLDKDTAGCLVIAKTRFAASTLAKTFRSRSARKIYWALVSGVPRVRQGRISTYVAREQQEDGDSRMRVAKHGDEGASHALTYYAVVDTSAQKLAWLSLKPVTGRTHQLRVHTAEMGHPIVGDPKYFNIENWNLPGGIQNRLHLLARRIVIPHPRGKGLIDVSAPLPPHMQQTWNLLGLDAKRYDPILDAPDD